MQDILPITQIGSLPFKKIKQAVKYSLRHGKPFLPELPKLDGFMLDWIKELICPSCLSEFCKNEFTTVKIQAPGPATLVMRGYSEDEAVGKIVKYISLIMEPLKAKEIILILDEPGLGQAGFNFEDLWTPIFKSFSVIPGVHCCGNMDWDVIFQSQAIEIISFNASQYDITKYLHYRGGKKIAWGIEKREDVKDFQKGDLITPPCGLSPLEYTVEDCEPVFHNLQQITRELLLGL